MWMIRALLVLRLFWAGWDNKGRPGCTIAWHQWRIWLFFGQFLGLLDDRHAVMLSSACVAVVWSWLDVVLWFHLPSRFYFTLILAGYSEPHNSPVSYHFHFEISTDIKNKRPDSASMINR